MRDLRVFVYADGLVLPVVIPLSCTSEALDGRLREIFAFDLIATRAEVWDGPAMILGIDAAGIAALVRLARPDARPDHDLETLH